MPKLTDKYVVYNEEAYRAGYCAARDGEGSSPPESASGWSLADWRAGYEDYVSGTDPAVTISHE